MRLFFAVELPSEVRAELGRLKADTEDSRLYRWVDSALLHVTLVFLGEQPAERLEAVRGAGEAAGRVSRPGRLCLGAPGTFGTRTAPRVLWVGLAGDLNALNELHGHLVTELRQAGLAAAEGEEQDRPYRPHITLARRRESAGPTRAGTSAQLTWPPRKAPPQPPAEFPLDRLTLFESRLSPRGPSYTPLQVVPLRG